MLVLCGCLYCGFNVVWFNVNVVCGLVLCVLWLWYCLCCVWFSVVVLVLCVFSSVWLLYWVV